MQIENNVDLKPYNTLQISVKGKYFVRIEKESDIQELIKNDLRKFEKHCIINGWANILFTDDFDGIVVKIETKWKEVRWRAIKVDFAKEDPTKMYNKAERAEAPVEAKVEAVEAAAEEAAEEDETVVDENAF